jgi:plastocyanin
LNSPWGLDLARGNFGDFGNALLVGNFGDSTINAFDPCSGEYLGALPDTGGAAVVNSGLWGLSFGNGRGAGDATSLYFTVGIPGPGNIEDHALFGSIQVADGSTAPKAQPSSVNIGNFAFAPPTITVAVGTQVRRTIQDGTAHTVTADDARFHPDNLEQSETFSQTFSAAGTYSYHCSIHPFLKGKIVVQ